MSDAQGLTTAENYILICLFISNLASLNNIFVLYSLLYVLLISIQKFKIIEKFSISEYTILFSRKGKPLIEIDGYTYYQKAVRANRKVRWACSISQRCRAQVYTVDKYIVQLNGNHDHWYYDMNRYIRFEILNIEPKHHQIRINGLWGRHFS